MPAGRPTAYKPEYAEKAFKLALLGLTDIEMANLFDVSEATFYNWRNAHPEFLEALKEGKDEADAKVANSLYHRAMGYSHPEEKVFISDGEVISHKTIKHYPPDTGAAMAWLKNRQPGKWRDRQELDLAIKEMPEIVIKRAE